MEDIVLELASLNGATNRQLPNFLRDASGRSEQLRASFLGPDSSCFHLKPRRTRSSPFACLSFRGGGGELRRTFNQLDTGAKGFLTEGDIRNYALDNGLPLSYVAPFVSAVLNCPASKRPIPEDAKRCVFFSAFSNFVRGREEALQKAFLLFDKDGDGKISVDDLAVSLTHVVITCPNTRCVYKPSMCGASNMVARSLLCKAATPQQMLSTPISLSATSKVTSAKVKSMKAAAAKKKAAALNLDISFQQFREFFLLLPQADMVVEYWLKAGRCPDIDHRVQFREGFDNTKASPWGHLLSGAVAGAASRTATAPLETLRLGVMSGTLEAGSLLEQANTIIQRGGGSWKALYRGNLVNVMRSAPQKALDFLAFDILKQALGGDSYAKTFAAAGMAGAASWSILYPLEVVRSRITSGLVTSHNIPCVLASIAKKEGLGALYKGLGWSVAGIIPEAAITYGLHDVLKRSYKNVRGEEPSVSISLAFGICSAFTGQTLAFPLESISRRMQVGQSLPAVLQEVTQQGGLKTLYRGIGAATLRLIPMACVSFGVYEFMRAQLVQLEEMRSKAEAEKEYLSLHCTPLMCC